MNKRNVPFSSGTRQESSTLFREPLPTAANQRQTILRLLRDAARVGRGVSGDVLRREYGFPQAPARIWELRNQFGFQVETRQDSETRMATYYFRGDPPEGWRRPAKQARLSLEAAAPIETKGSKPTERTLFSEAVRP